MTSKQGDPAAEMDANYDYRGDDIERPALVNELSSRVKGDVRFDNYSRQLYATDASLYEVTPIGVVFPRSTADVAAVMEYCAEQGIPVLPRGGGTSLGGQAVNEAVVLDFTRHMDGVLEISPDAQQAHVEPGIYLGTLNAALAEHDLKFAPDPAWGDKSTIGGAIGNNSTGTHSLKYGKTDAYLESVEVVLADGTVTTFGELTLKELRKRADPDGDLEARIHAQVARILDEKGDFIKETYPDLKRNVSGYNLDWLVEDIHGSERGVGEPDVEGGTVNLAKLIAGSEGTLAIITKGTVSLEPIPQTKALAMVCYESMLNAMDDVATILGHDPAAVELVDDVLIDLARETAEFEDVVTALPDGTGAVLLVEFYAGDDDDGRQKVANLLADRLPGTDAEGDPEDGRHRSNEPVRAFQTVEAHDEESYKRVWKLRKSGLPILLGRTTDDKHASFVEDCAVPPEHLSEYTRRFQQILDEHDTFASFYGHAGPGVLHVRPLVNTKTFEGVQDMESIADAVTDLVAELGGSVSGEHGDGRARTQWNRKLYGEQLWETFWQLKTAFDPDWLLNPGQVVHRDNAPTDMTEHHRFGPDYEFDAGFEPELNWENEQGFQGMAELCHGCGGCRGDQATTGGVMCPTFRASNEEIASTRGRANMLRQAMDGDLPQDPFTDKFVREVLDLCIGCKGCARDCPSEVDMAKMKAEVTHEYHQRHGVSLRDRLFANFDRLAAVGSALAPVSNWVPKLPGSQWLLERTIGIASERTLPSFRRKTLHDWFDRRGPQVAEVAAERKALLFTDTDTNYGHPEIGKAAVRVLEAAGVHVRLADHTETGRPAHSKGFLDKSRDTAEQNVNTLAPLVRGGWDVVIIEPSDAVMLQADYLDLLSGDDVETVAANTYGVCEYLDSYGLDENARFSAHDEHLIYHGHCHQKATMKDHHTVTVLRRAGYQVDPLDSSCCGMAGSFGYEAEHYSMSQAIGRILFEQIEDSPGETVVTPGTSCRTQLGDRNLDVDEPAHPIEKLNQALEDV